MKRFSFKRVMCLLLAICMVFTMVPSMIVTAEATESVQDLAYVEGDEILDESKTPITNTTEDPSQHIEEYPDEEENSSSVSEGEDASQADLTYTEECVLYVPEAMAVSTANDPYYSKYGVTYEQLFKLYPQYLSPSSVETILGAVENDYRSVINSYTDFQNGVASYMYALKNGFQILGREILSFYFDLTPSNEEKMRTNSARLLMERLCGIDDSLSISTDIVASRFSTMKDTYGAGTAIEKLQLIADLQESCENLTDAEVENLVNEMCGGLTDIFKYADTGVEYWQLIVGVIELQEIEIDMLCRLAQSLPRDDGLSADLELLLMEIDTNLWGHVKEHWLTENALSLLCEAVKKSIEIIAGEKIFTTTLATFLGKMVIKVVTDVLYQGAMADDIVQTIYLSNYASELKSAIINMNIDFKAKNANYKHNIDQYQFVYTAYLQAMQLTAESAADMAKDKRTKELLTNESELFYTLSYSRYIELCMQELRRDIDAGKVAPVKQTESSGSSTVVTPEESRVSIERKFQQLQAAYPPNQGVTWTGSYGGCTECFGFARFAFNKLFDCNMPSCYYNSRRYEYTNTNNVIKLGQLAGSSAVTESAVEELLSQALLGDILQVCGASQHTMMVVGVSDEGVTVYDCNWDGACSIYQRTISFASFAEKYSAAHASSESGVTLYRAANYDTLYWDGTDVFYDDSANFVIENGVLVKYNGKQPYIVIPEEVTAIGTKAFYDNDYLLGVTMGDAVESIEERAFYNCDNLLFCNFSSALESVGDYAFYNCENLASPLLPDNVTKIGKLSFSKCTSIVKVTIPNGVTEIASGAFRDCTTLSQVILPNNLRILGSVAFGNTAITEITIPKSLIACGGSDTAVVYEQDGEDLVLTGGPFVFCNNLKRISFEEGTTIIPTTLCAGCTGLEDIIIPDAMTEIGNHVFRDCLNLRTVSFGDNLTHIGDYAFYCCDNLSSLSMPNSTIVIGDFAFSKCTSITVVTIPNSVTEIASSAFRDCTSLSQVTLPNNLRILGSVAFGNTAITEITIPKSLVACGGSNSVVVYEQDGEDLVLTGGPFVFCNNLKRISFEEGTTTIQNALCGGCTGIEEIAIPDTITMIGESAFSMCTNLKAVMLPSTLKTLGAHSFYKTAITEINIPKSLSSCGSNSNDGYGPFGACEQLKTVAFEAGTEKIVKNLLAGCTGLREITIPDTITTVGERAFSLCANLKTVTFGENVETIESWAFDRCSALTQITLPETLTTMGSYAFGQCTKLTEITIPSSLTEVPQGAFSNCTSLAKVTLPSTLKTLGAHSFYKTAIAEINIPKSLSSCGSNSNDGYGPFGACEQLKTVTFEAGTEKIVKNLLAGCTGLREITIPDTITTVGERAFSLCTNLKTVTFGKNVEAIENWAFDRCSALTELTLPETLTTMGSYAFDECTRLTEITIPNSLTEVPQGAFFNCDSLAKVTVPRSVVKIANNAFAKAEDVTIFGHTGSYAEVFANENNIPFIALPDDEPNDEDCNGEHTSKTGEDWEKDENGHWKSCICGEIIESGDHEYGDDNICDICAYITDDLAPDIPAPDGLWCEEIPLQPYTGKAVTPAVAVYHRDKLLTEKVDYTVSYKNNKTVYAPVDTPEELAAFEAAVRTELAINPKAKTVMVGDQEVTIAKVPQIIITGKGNYGGKETIYFAISPVELNEEDFLIPALSAAYTGKNILPKPVVTWNETGKAIKWKTDYEVYLNYGTADELLIQSTEAKTAFMDAGTYNLTVVGKGNFSGTATLNYDISVYTLMSKVKIGGWASSLPWNADGAVQTNLVLSDSGKKVDGQAYTLVEGVDYTVSYRNNTVAGTATAVFTGLGEYIGQVTKTFKITGLAISKAVVTGLPKAMDYTGEAITLSDYVLTDKASGEELVEGVDYTVAYEKNTAKGTATILFTGTNKYSGTLKKTFKINGYDILKNTAGLFFVEEDIVAPFMKGGAKPVPVVTFNGKVLKAGTDYTLAYKNNTAVADETAAKAPMITISGKGNFSGKVTVNFTIQPKPLAEVELLVDDKPFTAKATGLPTVSLVDDDGKKLAAGKDYGKVVSYTYTGFVELNDGTVRNAGDTVDKKDSIPVGTVLRVTVEGMGGYTGEASTTYRIVPASLAKATVKVANQQYTGKPIIPSKDDITVMLNKVELNADNYEIVSCTNNVNKGSATLVIRGVGDEYGGIKPVKFKIDAKTLFWSDVTMALFGLFS